MWAPSVAPHAPLIAGRRFRGSAVGAFDDVWRSPPSCWGSTRSHPAPYGVAGLSFRTKMLAGSASWVMAKNGNTAAPLEPSPS
jgi:hypothetical protein